MTEKAKRITDKIYRLYGTDSGIVFGIEDRSVIEAVVEATLMIVDNEEDKEMTDKQKAPILTNEEMLRVASVSPKYPLSAVKGLITEACLHQIDKCHEYYTRQPQNTDKLEAIKQIVEKAISDVDKLPIEVSKNVLGDKWRYINAIADALVKSHLFHSDVPDDEALKGEIAEIVWADDTGSSAGWRTSHEFVHKSGHNYNIAAQILNLVKPYYEGKIEQVRKEERKELVSLNDIWQDKWRELVVKAKQDAKREFVKWGEGECPHSPYRNSSGVIITEKRRYCLQCWQSYIKEIGK
jgi:hypothetical protein